MVCFSHTMFHPPPDSCRDFDLREYLPANGGFTENARPWKNAMIPKACVSCSIPSISAIKMVLKQTTVPVKKTTLFHFGKSQNINTRTGIIGL